MTTKIIMYTTQVPMVAADGGDEAQHEHGEAADPHDGGD